MIQPDTKTMQNVYFLIIICLLLLFQSIAPWLIRKIFKEYYHTDIGHMFLLTIEFIIIFILYSYFNNFFTLLLTETESTDISTKIENISNDLFAASSELSSIQQELESRIEYVADLKKEAEIAENVISLSDEQVNAVQAKLNQELDASSNKGLMQNILISSFFFMLGLIVQPILKAIKRKSDTAPEDGTSASHDNKYSDEEIEQAIKLLNSINQNKGSHDE